MSKETSSDPLEFVRSMWSNMGFTLPGMVTPTLDVDELEKRITDMKAVEGWLRMNLSMLQASIQGLEVQAATLTTIRAMGEAVTHRAQEEPTAESGGLANPFSATALWPWMQAAGTASAEKAAPEEPAPAPAAAPAGEATTKENAATAAGANAAEAFASAASAASNAAMWPWQMLSAEAAKTAKAAPVKKAPAKKRAASASTKAKPAAADGGDKRATRAPEKKRAPAKKS